MKKSMNAVAAALALTMAAGVVYAKEAKSLKEGEALFKQHCATCHPDGGNIVNPKKTLKAADLKANKVSGVNGIVKLMRHPGPGMETFDAKTVPERQAKMIAEYVLKAFK